MPQTICNSWKSCKKVEFRLILSAYPCIGAISAEHSSSELRVIRTNVHPHRFVVLLPADYCPPVQIVLREYKQDSDSNNEETKLKYQYYGLAASRKKKKQSIVDRMYLISYIYQYWLTLPFRNIYIYDIDLTVL